MKLDTTMLANAVARLREGLERHRGNPDDAQLRDGLIQRFEFTYEAACASIKRHLEAVSPSPGIYDAMPFPDLIRSANERGILSGDWPKWKTYRDMRGKTSHAYNEKLALLVVEGIPDFLREAEHLLRELQKAHA
jgi:nucleotidyltransferase substrate binding protein (TIGR01987 family)